MAHWAFVNKHDVVIDVIVGRDEDDLAEGVTSWEDYYGAVRGQRCLRTSYNTFGNQHLTGGEPFRGNYAGIGFQYREDLDAFIPPQPQPTDEVAEWVLNEETFLWEPVGA